MTNGGASARRLTVDVFLAPCDALARTDEERAVYAALTVAATHLRIWQPQTTLMVTAAEAGMPRFAAAAQRARDRGMPVQVRGSGGGAVCLGPGTLVVSHLYSSASADIAASYRRFAAALTTAIAAVGIDLLAQRVARAYCDGRFDLAWRGRKVGGMAQRRAVNQGLVRVWLHAVLSIEAESVDYPNEVLRFYADLQSPRIADPAAATTLSHCLPPGGNAKDLLQRSADSIVRIFREDAISTLDRQSPRRFA